MIMDLEKKNVILAKKIVLEAEKVRKLELKIDDLTVCPLQPSVGVVFRLLRHSWGHWLVCSGWLCSIDCNSVR